MVELWQKGCSLNDISRISGKSRAKVIAWRKSGRTNAHPPFGFSYYLGQLTIEPREHEIFLLIERLAKEGMNSNAIAEHLNSKGLKPRRAKLWNRNSIVLGVKRLDRPAARKN